MNLDPNRACGGGAQRTRLDDQWERERTPGWGLGPRLELLIFAKDDTYGWVVRVERYFQIKGVEDDEKLELALVAMEGEALIWYEWWEAQVPYPTWREFKEDLIKRL